MGFAAWPPLWIVVLRDTIEISMGLVIRASAGASLVLVACLSVELPPDLPVDAGLGGDAGDSGAVRDALGDAPEEGNASVTPFFVGSRMTIGTMAVLQAGNVVGAKSGDVLVAGWMGPNNLTLAAPPEWTPVGSAESSSVNGHPHTFWAGYHVLGASESETTTYPFSITTQVVIPQTVQLLAYRGVNAVEPVKPAIAQTFGLNCSGTAQPPAITARGRSVAVYVIGTADQTAGEVAGVKLAETITGLATYRTGSPVPDGTTFVPPDFVGYSCPFTWFGASFGIVGGP